MTFAVIVKVPSELREPLIARIGLKATDSIGSA